MRKATMSFDERRQTLLAHMAGKKAAKSSISKKIKFSNQDVLEFLRKLDQFETESLKSSLVFK